jgi:hypothetical protein
VSTVVFQSTEGLLALGGMAEDEVLDG